MDNYIYTLGNSLYINVTNRCTNSCVFCVRTKTDNMGGQRLWLESEPTAEQVIILIHDQEKYDEIVFCGFGEPTEKLDVLLEICRYLKKFRTPIRINTNGHASMIAGKDTAPMFKGLVDTISISLNASNARHYQELCQCQEGEKGFYEMLDFARKVKEYVPNVVLSVVDIMDKQEIEECRNIAQELGVKFRIRELITEEED